jgi:hypothetical protein
MKSPYYLCDVYLRVPHPRLPESRNSGNRREGLYNIIQTNMRHVGDYFFPEFSFYSRCFKISVSL